MPADRCGTAGSWPRARPGLYRVPARLAMPRCCPSRVWWVPLLPGTRRSRGIGGPQGCHPPVPRAHWGWHRLTSLSCSGLQAGLSLPQTCGRGPWPCWGLWTPTGPQHWDTVTHTPAVPCGSASSALGTCDACGCALQGAIEKDAVHTAGSSGAQCHLSPCHGPVRILWYGRLCHAWSCTGPFQSHGRDTRAIVPHTLPMPRMGSWHHMVHPHCGCDPTVPPGLQAVAACVRVTLPCACLPVPWPTWLLSLSPVTFLDCGESRHTTFLSDDTRFKVRRDGVISATRPVQLHRRVISFSVQTWDAAGKKHSARVTLRRQWQGHHRHHHREEQVRPQGHRSPSPREERAAGLVRSWHRAALCPTGGGTHPADLP